MPRASTLPPISGIGLKPEHYAPLLGLDDSGGGVRPGWVEIHPQNYFCAGGPPHRWLTAVADALPVSFHSTGLSLGTASGVDAWELDQLAILVDRYQPASISDHLSWSNSASEKFPDLLPVPYTYEALAHFGRAIDQVQTRLKRAILIENPSRYLAFRDDMISETEFLALLCRRAGCGLLLDINNVEVSACNLDFDAASWLEEIDPALVGEIHLAGHATELYDDGSQLKIDDHGWPVSEPCWTLYADFITRAGAKPTLIERDSNLPSYAELMREADIAQGILCGENRHVCVA